MWISYKLDGKRQAGFNWLGVLILIGMDGTDKSRSIESSKSLISSVTSICSSDLLPRKICIVTTVATILVTVVH